MSLLSFKFGTVGAPISTPKKPGGSLEAIVRLAELDLNSFELGWVQSVRISEKTCAAIKETAHSCNVALSVHAPYYINLNANDSEWPKSRRRLMDAAYYGNLSGATDIIFHPGTYFGAQPEQVLPKVIERLQDCLTELLLANNPLILRPETMGKPAMIGSLDDLLCLSQSLSGLEPCLDFAHLHARPGDGSNNTYEEWANVLNVYVDKLGEGSLSRLHIHLSGIQYGSKGEKEHLPIGQSDLDLTALLSALRDFHCQGRILCESPVLEEDALHIQKVWCEVSGESVT